MNALVRGCWRKLLSRGGPALVAMALVGSVHGQTSVITSIHKNGLLTWTSTTNDVQSYAIEWASSLTGAWHDTWTHLTNIAPVEGTMATNVPMFYRVSATLRPQPRMAGDICYNAEPLGPDQLVSGQTTGFVNDYNATACGTPSPGPDRVYATTLPPGLVLTAQLMPAFSFDAVLYLVAAPSTNCESGPASCLAAADLHGPGGPEVVGCSNPYPDAVTVNVIVDGHGAQDAGSYTLLLTIAPK